MTEAAVIARTDSTPSLWDRTISPHEESLKAAITNYMPRLYGVAFRTLRNPEDAEDALQDALLSAFKNLSRFKGDAKITTWLTAIVLNSARMMIRRRVTRRAVSLNQISENQPVSIENLLVDDAPGPEELYTQVELREKLERVSKRLSPRMRTAFKLVVLKGLSTQAAARALGVSTGTLKTRLFHARRQVSEILRKSTSARNSTRSLSSPSVQKPARTRQFMSQAQHKPQHRRTGAFNETQFQQLPWLGATNGNGTCESLSLDV